MDLKTISQEYLETQKKLHQNPNYGVASLEMAPFVKKIFEDSNFISISYYGAGKKNLEKKLLELGLKILIITLMTQSSQNMDHQKKQILFAA